MNRTPNLVLILLLGLSSIFVPSETRAQAKPTDPAAVRRAAEHKAAVEYFATKVDQEEIVRIPMRDGIRLNGTLYFPRNLPRQNLPTVLWFFPYHINGVSAENQRLLENGYA